MNFEERYLAKLQRKLENHAGHPDCLESLRRQLVDWEAGGQERYMKGKRQWRSNPL